MRLARAFHFNNRLLIQPSPAPMLCLLFDPYVESDLERYLLCSIIYLENACLMALKLPRNTLYDTTATLTYVSMISVKFNRFK